MTSIPQIASLISRLLASFPDRAGEDAEAKARAYFIIAEGLPFKYLAVAVERFCRGEVKGQSLRFCPSTAELAQEVSRLQHLDAHAERRRREEIEARSRPLAIAPPPPTDEQRLAMLKRLQSKFPQFQLRDFGAASAKSEPSE